MQISQLYPRRFATGDDLGDQTPELTVARVTMEQVGPTKKPVIWFFNARKGVILHATLARQIAALIGDDTDAWTGKKITLHTVPCRRPDGTRALSIRARDPAATPTSGLRPPTSGPRPTPGSTRHYIHCTPDPDALRLAAQA